MGYRGFIIHDKDPHGIFKGLQTWFVMLLITYY